MSGIRFGAFVHGLNPPEELFAQARRSEELGFDSLWTGDHVSFHNPLQLSKRYSQDFTPLAERYGIIGTPSQCAEQIERFVQAGCRYFLMNPIAERQDQRERIETIAAEIVPRFRS